MSSIPFLREHVTSVKNALRDEFSEIGSAHLSEALAAALGYRTHAALISELPRAGADPDYVWIDEEAFDAKLTELGHHPDLEFSFDELKVPSLLNTTCSRAWSIEYKSMRDIAWRNVVVCAVNEGLRLRLFSLRENDNRWTGWTGKYDSAGVKSTRFDFTLPNGLAASVYVGDAGFGELAIHVAVLPTKRAPDLISGWDVGFSAGEAFAGSWLERERGAWIQSTTSGFKCRRGLLSSLASLKVRTHGFGDRGRMIM